MKKTVKDIIVFNYIRRIPKSIPAGQIMVHNQVKPAYPIGMNGFRVWLDVLTDDYERCHCGWANGLEHYRVCKAWKQ